MRDDIYQAIAESASSLKLSLPPSELAAVIEEHELDSVNLEAVLAVFQYLQDKQHETSVHYLLKTSRLPTRALKTFDNFDFANIHGKDVKSLENLATLFPLHSHKNIAFIGPPGVGKTHLGMAFGRECCNCGFKTYYIKATELNQRFTKARKYGREGSVVSGLVRPSCLIIDEIGRCVFDVPNTRMFFDMIDRRNEKDGSNCIIFTSNSFPKDWREYFTEEDSLLCALGRAFDDAIVYIFKGKSYRGKKCSTMALVAGDSKSDVITNE